MKNRLTLITATVALFAAMAGSPAAADEHSAHHPDASASATGDAAAAPAKHVKAKSKSTRKASREDQQQAMMACTQMSQQASALRAMHDKVMSAKTPQERDAALGEQMQMMRDGMSMMDSMDMHGKGPSTGASGAAPMNMMEMNKGGMPMSGKGGGMMGMSCNHDTMSCRMELMHSMMTSMMDQMAARAPGGSK